MFYLISVSPGGVPFDMVGPGTWEQCVERMIARLDNSKEKYYRGDIEADGLWEASDWGSRSGGHYIVTATDF